MIDLAEAFRVYLNACNLRDWDVLEQMLSPELRVNNVEQTAAVYLKSLDALIADRPDLHWVAEHVIVSGNDLATTLHTRSNSQSGVEVAIFQWADDRISAVWTVGDLDHGSR